MNTAKPLLAVVETEDYGPGKPIPPPEEPPPLPPAAIDSDEPAVLDARATRDRASDAVTTAETAFAADATDERWRAVVTAKVARERADVLLRAAERAQTERREKAERERVADLRARHAAAVARCDDEAFRTALEPVMIRAAQIDREQFELMARIGEITRAQNVAVNEASQLARALGDPTLSVPRYRNEDDALSHVGWAVYDMRAASGVPRHEWEGLTRHWTGLRTDGVRAGAVMPAFLDRVQAAASKPSKARGAK